MSDRDAYRIHEVAKRTGMSVRTLWRRIADDKLPAVQDGSTTLILAKDLEAYLASLPKARKAAQS